jgi:ketosteroid isomerase-like protein
VPHRAVQELRRLYPTWEFRRQAAGEFDDVFRALAHPDFEIRLPAAYPDLDEVRGLEGVNALFRGFGQVWDEWRFEPELLFDGGDRAVVYLTLVARGKGSGAETATRGAHLWRLRGERFSRVEVYLDREEALAEAGLTGAQAEPFELPRDAARTP